MAVLGLLACSGDPRVTPPQIIQLSAIGIDGGARNLERGTRDTLSATATEPDGDTVAVPVVWRSSNERVAVFQRGGVLVAVDTGTTVITASSLGVSSPPVVFQVVWTGPATIAKGTWSPLAARSPGAALTDSVRVVVTNVAGVPVPNATVAFTVTEGNGSVSPATATTNQVGIATAQWTLGPVAGSNTITASVVRSDGTPDPLVSDNLVVFTINSYNALTVQAGNNQTAQLLSELPVQPSVRLVDTLGAPRAGVPVAFTVFANGRVTSPVVSTSADGIASPGTWTLGDIPGTQLLEARVEDAKVSLQATATGTPIYYKPSMVSAGGFTTCALETGGVVACWGAEQQIGTGDTTDTSTPRPVSGALVATIVTAGATHNCALTSARAAWCWGLNALVDTTGATVNAAVPTRLQSDIAWKQISTGVAHSCGITLLDVAYCWGFNNAAVAGQLGDGTTVNRFAPTPVVGGFSFSEIASGADHTCGLTNGAAFCWGQNQSGQLGDGTTQARTSPTAVVGGVSFASIGTGTAISCGLTPQPQGRVYCWGGISGTAVLTPITYATAPAFVSLTVGGAHACALTAESTAYCWGLNNWGQLGDSSQTRRNSPTRVAGDLRFTQISAGFLHTCGITTAGAAACWGFNRSGELGDSTAAFRVAPRHVVLGVNP
jgi:alpha-tubulin suppressor-like RCC1 family protein